MFSRHLFLFFFSCSRPHRDLHSFPTRRSSDLECPHRVGDGTDGRVDHLFRMGNKRSEEHTSELQSRLHLVCRLLLEKKKQKSGMSHVRKSYLTSNSLV